MRWAGWEWHRDFGGDGELGAGGVKQERAELREEQQRRGERGERIWSRRGTTCDGYREVRTSVAKAVERGMDGTTVRAGASREKRGEVRREREAWARGRWREATGAVWRTTRKGEKDKQIEVERDLGGDE